MKRIRWSAAQAFVLASGTAMMMGCASQTVAHAGSVELIASSKQALGSDVAEVDVTITAADISSPITDTLTLVSGRWSGTIDAVPAGADRTIQAVALDGSGSTIYSGTVTGVVISSNSPTMVAMVLQDTAPATSFGDAAPVIDAVEASAQAIEPNGYISLNVWAHDPDAGDVLTYAWTATDGSFDDPTNTAPTWTAPATPETVTITVTATDLSGVSASMSFDVVVSSTGTANISARFNTWPQVSMVNATNPQLQPGSSTAVTATASDPDGDPLTYAWSADCDGTFANPSAVNTQFTLNSATSDTCNLTMTVSDGQGGTASGTLQISTGAAPSLETPPQIDVVTQSATQAAPGDVITFNVKAHAAQGELVTFTWAKDQGTLGTPDTTADGSTITWTAPAGFAASADITVNVRAGGYLTSFDFFVDPAP